MTEPDWSKAPEWARYWAVTNIGLAYWYEHQPTEAQWWYRPADGRWEIAGLQNTWRDSLRERP